MDDNVTRMNLIVGDDIPDKLRQLAGGKRRMGEHITELVRAAYAGVVPQEEVGLLTASVKLVSARIDEIDARLVQMERRLEQLQRGL